MNICRATWTQRHLAALFVFTLVASAGQVDAAENLHVGGCNIRLLGDADAGEIPDAYRDVIVTTSERHRKIIEDGLRLMPELTCASATRVVFVDDARYLAEDGWVLARSPDLVFLNYASHLTSSKATQAFLHESTHTADQLLNSQREQGGILDGLIGENLYPKGEASADVWPASTRAKARQVVDNNRLRGGYRAEWVRIHRNFQAFGLASDYAIAGQTSVVEPASAGFTSEYGRSAVGEDIAEFAGWMLAAPLFDEDSEDLQNRACRAMQIAGQSTVSSDVAALFTKANFLLSTGLVTRSAYDQCVGHLKLPGNGAGVFVYGIDNEAEQLKRSFTNGVKVGIGKHENLEQYVFTYSVSGRAEFDAKEYPASVSLRLAIAPESKDLSVVSWPRGIFDLKTLGNRFAIELPDAPAGSFVGIEGVVLISYASSHRIEGSVFLQKAVRIHAPLPVPQTGLPLRFIFRAKK